MVSEYGDEGVIGDGRGMRLALLLSLKGVFEVGLAFMLGKTIGGAAYGVGGGDCSTTDNVGLNGVRSSNTSLGLAPSPKEEDDRMRRDRRWFRDSVLGGRSRKDLMGMAFAFLFFSLARRAHTAATITMSVTPAMPAPEAVRIVERFGNDPFEPDKLEDESGVDVVEEVDDEVDDGKVLDAVAWAEESVLLLVDMVGWLVDVVAVFDIDGDE